MDCESFINGLITMDENLVKSEIEKLTVDLYPHPAEEDLIGHAGNIQTLIDRINAGCDDITASLICYACIYTYPAQSEILIEYFDQGHRKEVIIDVHTPENDILRFAGLHQ